MWLAVTALAMIAIVFLVKTLLLHQGILVAAMLGHNTNNVQGVEDACDLALEVLVPCGFLLLADYIYLVERHLSGKPRQRGFEVQRSTRSAGT